MTEGESFKPNRGEREIFDMTTSESIVAKPTRRRLFPMGFWLGLVVGLALMIGVILAGLPFEPKLRIRLSGDDVTRAGGVKVVLQDRYVRWTQTCIGGCDDLQVLTELGEDVYSFKIPNAAGDCLFCEGIYLGGGNRRDWHISGRPKLTAKDTFLEDADADKPWPAEEYNRN